jgi:hypothetical protein
LWQRAIFLAIYAFLLRVPSELLPMVIAMNGFCSAGLAEHAAKGSNNFCVWYTVSVRCRNATLMGFDLALRQSNLEPRRRTTVRHATLAS